MNTEDLKKAIEQAEEVVVVVKDPDLKRSAFEKVLERLLNGHGRAAPAHAAGLHEEVKAPKSAKVAKAQAKKDGPKARVVALIEEGYFDEPKTLGELVAELATTRGVHLDRKQVSTIVLRLTREDKALRRKTGPSAEEPYVYSKW